MSLTNAKKSKKTPMRVKLEREAWAKSDARRDAGLVEPDSIEKIRNLSYGPYGEANLLDLYLPKGVSGLLPVIVSIHGGGYFYGDKELYRFYTMHLAEFGFAVINFNYRLAPEFHFPAQLEDSAKVIEWLSNNADKYGLDKDNVFLVGDSAGAQMITHYALIHSNPEFAALFDFSVATDVKIRAISAACGIYDMARRRGINMNQQIIFDLLGDEVSLEDERLKVLENINSDYPPTYLFTSYCDFLCQECKPMAELLEARGVESEYHIFGTPDYKECAHVFHCNMRMEEGEKANKAQIEFMKKHIVR